MATVKKNVQVLEKNPGVKIAWSQSGNKLIFGDDDLSIRCDTRQRDWPVQVDICADEDGNLVIGVGKGRYYVAQVQIPPTAYKETEIEVTEEEDADGGTMGEEGRTHIKREVQPLNMNEVILTLWSVDGMPLAKQ